MKTFDELQQRITDSGLMTAADVQSQLAAWKEATGLDENSSPQNLLDWLVEKELVTQFQADALAAGIAGPFMLGPYRVYEQVTAGKLGGVFRAVHEEFDQSVSLKVFASAETADAEKAARIGRELRVAVELDHPNVIRSYQLGKIGATYYLAMEDLKGQSLEQKLDSQGALPYKTACSFVQQIAHGLSHLHENGVVHRDIRPANIWITESGVAKLMEFGAARDAYAFLDAPEADMDVTTDDSVIGEYDYMAPEQAMDARDAEARSDIYALGSTLYHALTGRPPFDEKNPAKLVLRHAKDTPDPVSSLVADVPHQLDDTIAAMMAKQPEDRYKDANNVAFALEPFVEKEAVVESAPDVGQEVSSQYLEWTQSSQPTDSTEMPDEAVAVTPELTQFLDFLSHKKVKKRRRR